MSKLNYDTLNIFFDNCVIGLALTDKSGRFIKVNPVLCKLLEYTESELHNKLIDDITHPEDIAASKDMTKKVISKDISGYTMHKRCITKRNEIVWVIVTIIPIFKEDYDVNLMFQVEHASKQENITSKQEDEITIFSIIAKHAKSFVIACITSVSILVGLGVAFWSTVDKVNRIEEINRQNSELILKLIEKSLDDNTNKVP